MDTGNNLREIFLAALDAENPAERVEILDKACAGDRKLRLRVEALLEADAEGSGLAEPDPSPGLGVRPGALTRIGPYRLIEQIGEGGCGIVYLADQKAPVRRRVALKVIKLGMDTEQVVARFEAERQALALMDHPGIAKVYDAGATEAGRPYFVMELVRGVPLTDYCDHQRLDTRARLELFAVVCQAVQHAHQKGSHPPGSQTVQRPGRPSTTGSRNRRSSTSGSPKRPGGSSPRRHSTPPSSRWSGRRPT